MISPQFILPIADELVVDLFAGGGGASVGIEAALGRHVDIAVNHDPEAVDLHMANHPQTRHFVSDVFEVDPITVTDGRPVGLLWASPDCKHFSKAKGGKPVSKKIRALAWVVIKWAQAVQPRVIMLENVEEFATWGPTIAKTDGNGKAQRDANGKVVHMPCPKRKGQTFKRWLGQLRNLGYQVEWRELRASDYGAPTIRKRLFLIARRDGQPIAWPEPTHGPGRKKPWRTAAECIDWTLPAHSIFMEPAEAKKIGIKRPLAEATMRRIAHGVQKYVIEAAEPFIVTLAHGEQSPSGVKRWGKGHRDIKQPMPTITASGGYGLVAPFITEHANASTQRNMPADEPLRTQCAQVKGGHFALVSPTLIEIGYGERPGQAPRAPGLDKPLGTAVAGGIKHALVSAFLAKHYTGVTGSDLRDPLGTATSVDHHSLVTAQLVGCGGRAGQSRPRDASEPMQTITAKADTAVITSNLIKLRGTSSTAATDEPLHTISAGGTHHAEVRAFLVKYYGTDQDPKLREPLHTVTTKDRYGLVTVHGQEYAIADIGLRMLAPRELFRAQGFPENYIIGDNPAQGLSLTKSSQVRMCGNSVCPPLAAALVRANLSEIAIRRTA